jgi:hypothetical protein
LLSDRLYGITFADKSTGKMNSFYLLLSILKEVAETFPQTAEIFPKPFGIHHAYCRNLPAALRHTSCILQKPSRSLRHIPCILQETFPNPSAHFYPAAEILQQPVEAK